jgi:hypothetical protein
MYEALGSIPSIEKEKKKKMKEPEASGIKFFLKKLSLELILPICH